MVHQFEPFLEEVARETLLKLLGYKMAQLQDLIPDIVAESKRRLYEASETNAHKPHDQLNLVSLSGSPKQCNAVASYDIAPEQSKSSASSESVVCGSRNRAVSRRGRHKRRREHRGSHGPYMHFWQSA